MLIQGKVLLYIVEHIARPWGISKSPLRLTLFERKEGTHGRITAQVVLERNGGLKLEISIFDDPGNSLFSRMLNNVTFRCKRIISHLCEIN